MVSVEYLDGITTEEGAPALYREGTGNIGVLRNAEIADGDPFL